MKVEVYRNLHKNCWSVRDTKTGRVIQHRPSIAIRDAKLVVRPAGRAKVLREQRKNVHAFVRGEIAEPQRMVQELLQAIDREQPLRPTEQISYNPYKHDSFVYTDSGDPVYDIDYIYLADDGKGWTYA